MNLLNLSLPPSYKFINCRRESMYFIVLFILSWMCFFYFADKNNIRKYYGAVMYSSFLGLLTDLIMVTYMLWSYQGLPSPSYSIPLLLDFSIYPVVSYLFLQSLPPTWGKIIRNTLIWTAAAATFEWITLKTGYMGHHKWWNLYYSIGADTVIFLSIACLYRYYSQAYNALSSNPKK